MQGKKYRRALFIGRFQPFHNGHMKAIEDIAGQSDRIAIVVAGPIKPDAKNPFSFGERKDMIALAMQSKGIRSFSVSELCDVNDDRIWTDAIAELGHFDVAYSRNPWTFRCLKKAGIFVVKHEFYERYKNCGREIRKRIMLGKRWESLVPPAVFGYVIKINGEQRIRKSI